jgi:hypothetical protein
MQSFQTSSLSQFNKSHLLEHSGLRDACPEVYNGVQKFIANLENME